MYYIHHGEWLQDERTVIMHVWRQGGYLVLIKDGKPSLTASFPIEVREFENLNDAIEVLKSYYDCNVHRHAKSFSICAGVLQLPDHKDLVLALGYWKRDINKVWDGVEA